MKEQIFYLAGMLIAMVFAYRFMSKVKDIPKEEDKEPVEFKDSEENESNDFERE